MRDWRNPEIEWDDGNEEHIIRHDVYPDAEFASSLYGS